MTRGEGTRTGVQFLADLIPEFDRVVFEDDGVVVDSEASAATSESTRKNDS